MSAYIDIDDAEGSETLTLQGEWFGNRTTSNRLTFTITEATPDDFDITLSAPRTTLTEGESVRLTATANRAVAEDLTIEIELVEWASTGSRDDYTVGDIVIRSGQTTGSVQLTVLNDGEQEETETLSFSGRWSKFDATDRLTFTVEDAEDPPDELRVRLSADRTTLTEGQSVRLTATADRAVTEDLAIDVWRRGTGSTAGWNDVDIVPDPFVIRSGRTEASTMLTAHLDGETEGAETLILFGRWDNLSRETNNLRLTIEDAADPSGELTIRLCCDIYDLQEDTGVWLVATANRAVTEDLTIEIVGVGGSASGNDYSVDDIVIESGQTSGGVALWVLADDVQE